MTGAQNPRALLAQWGLRPKKRFGQNFLVDPAAAVRIARLALENAPGDARVLEIGAGTGTLTSALLDQGARVTALEIDPDLVALLKAREDLAGADVVGADALDFDYARWAAGGEWIVAGNLPYNVATPLVTRLVEMDRGPASLCVMVQKDVAERFAAAPGTKAYGSLSVAVQYAMQVRTAFTLGPSSFFPSPKVRSTVVALRRRAEPAVRPRDLALFRKVVRAAFAYRRKTLANSLALALSIDRAAAERALQTSQLAPEIRGERLTLHDFAAVADALAAQEFH